MESVNVSLTVVVLLVAVALVFDFLNGFHDAANSIATIVSTKVLTPFQAVLWAAFFNFSAFFISKYIIGGFGIADTIAKSVTIQKGDPLALYVILAGLLSASGARESGLGGSVAFVSRQTGAVRIAPLG